MVGEGEDEQAHRRAARGSAPTTEQPSAARDGTRALPPRRRAVDDVAASTDGDFVAELAASGEVSGAGVQGAVSRSKAMT